MRKTNPDIMQVIMTIGNRDLPDREKTLFLCSKKTPIELYEYVFRWTDSLTERDCIACFNSTDMEDEVLKALLVAKVPTVLYVMNRFTDLNNIQIEQALRERRMAIVVLRRDEPQGKGQTPADDEQLIALHNDGKSTKELASMFGRKEGAIRSRIKKLMKTNDGEQ